jgi:hypothetical protein
MSIVPFAMVTRAAGDSASIRQLPKGLLPVAQPVRSNAMPKSQTPLRTCILNLACGVAYHGGDVRKSKNRG